MSLNSTFKIPSPVGGVPLSSDFAPSIIFAVMYGLLVPVIFYRLISPKSRNTLLIGTSTFAVERCVHEHMDCLNEIWGTIYFRVVIFSLRAVQSRNEEKRNSKGLTTYMQITIGMGFISVAQDLVNLLRVLLVKSTNGPSPVANQSSTPGPPPLLPPLEHKGHIQEDNPRLRSRYRRFSGVMSLAFLAAIVPGVIANSHYSSALTNQNMARKIMRLR